MAGHSKWANIKHKKSKEDEKRGKIFSKLSKRITSAARDGGGDIESNAELRLVVQKAKDVNMPNDNIERAIKRGTGEIEGFSYENFVYEGYGPGGIALYIDLMSDNRNRTASEIRHLLTSNGGNLGERGCVAWMFNRQGQIIIDAEASPIDSEELMLNAIDLGALDFSEEGAIYTIITAPGDLETIANQLKEQGITIESADVAMIADNIVKLDQKTAPKAIKIMELLEDHDDVQEVYSNFDIPEEILKGLEE